MKIFARVLIVLFSIVTGVVAGNGPAKADLRFCNLTSSSSQIVEGHKTPRDGLTVKGTVTVKAGQCGVVVPGRLTAPHYFVHVAKTSGGYGGNSHLCVMTMYDFTIAGEDAPNFRCGGPSVLSIHGHDVVEKLEDFLSLNTNGYATLILTQRKDATFHYQLK